MNFLVDADACPVNEIVIQVAREHNIPVMLFFDDSHFYQHDYAKVIIKPSGADSVDYAIVAETQKDDIVITQDYGLAALVIAKGAKAINQNGLVYTASNIDMLLQSRYINSKIRNSGGRTKGPKKRTKDNDIEFYEALLKLILK